MRIITSAYSATGIKKCNQDGYLVKYGYYNNRLIGIAAICDGMGGLDAGEKASDFVISNLETWFMEEFKELLIKGSIEQSLNQIITNYLANLNSDLINYGHKLNMRMGTTVSILLLVENDYYLYHIGDSRIYKKSNQAIKLLTEDQNLAAKKVREGIMIPEIAKNSSERSLLLQCVGVRDNIEVYQKKGHVQVGNSFLLCTDGFYVQLTNYEIYWLLNKSTKKQNKILNQLKRCIFLVRKRGELDDATGIIVHIIND